MRKVSFLLGNPFNDSRVSTLRLILFAQNAFAALKDDFNDVAVLVNGKVERLLVSLGTIDQAKAEGRGSGSALRSYKKKLHAFMKQHNDGFSVALGGRESMAFLAFFPSGLSEYTKLSDTEAPAVMERLKKSVADYGAQLPAAIRDGLQPLLEEWGTLRSSQQYLMETIDAKRADRTVERIDLELALLKALHEVALAHLGKPEESAHYFNVKLLTGRVGRKKKEEDAAVN